MKILKLTLIWLMFINALSAQTVMELASNEMKYWKLRGRLTGDDNNKGAYNGFMTVGSGKGMSIPATNRHPTYTRENPIFKSGAECASQMINNIPVYAQYDPNTGNVISGSPLIDPRDGKELKGIMGWGDNPLITMGNYIAVLATEWELLNMQGGNTNNTKRELYYALEAIDRLDKDAEPTLYGFNANKNGFLMRGDVPIKFELDNSGQNIDLALSHISCSPPGVPETQETCDRIKTVKKYTNAMSQDEVIGLLMGLRFIDHCIPSSITYNGQSLKQWGAEITERIIKYVKKGGDTNWWLITDPLDGLPVCRGPMSIIFSYPMARIGEKICNTPLQNWWSLNVGLSIWKEMKNATAMNNSTMTSLIFLQVPNFLLTNSKYDFNSYEPIFLPGADYGNPFGGNPLVIGHESAYQISLFLKLATCANAGARCYYPFWDCKGKQLINSVSQTYHKNLYDLMGSVLNNYTPIQDESYWRSEFNKMGCACNCFQTINSVSYEGCPSYLNPTNTSSYTTDLWNTENRWAEYRSAIPKANTLDEYNGLDYMLAYNLYRLKFYSGYTPKIRKAITKPDGFPYVYNVPSGTQYIGNQNAPLPLKAVFSIESGNTKMNSGSDVSYYAGSEIILKPGFYAMPGSVFKAQIKEYDCTPSSFFLGGPTKILYKTDDTLTQTTFLDEIDTTINNIIEDTVYETEPQYDTNIIWVTHKGDTAWISYNPDYLFPEDGSAPIYSPQGNNYKTFVDPLTSKSISLYPNPTGGDIYVEYTLYYDSEVKVYVTNEFGQQMHVGSEAIFKQSKGKQKITLQTNSFASGIYFCSIEINGHKEVKKFTITR